MTKCNDCNGTGQYVGFSVVEDCKKCEGKGSLRDGKVFYADKKVIPGGCDVSPEGWYSVSLTETETNSSGFAYVELGKDTYAGHCTPLNVPVPSNLDRKDIYELGRKGPYHKYVNFPVQLTEKLSSQEGVSFGGDDGTGHSVSLACETPYDQTESPKINLPPHHKSVSFTIKNAEQNAAFKELMDKYYYPEIAKLMGIPKELMENPVTRQSNGVS